jgi:hypothetical protein
MDKSLPWWQNAEKRAQVHDGGDLNVIKAHHQSPDARPERPASNTEARIRVAEEPEGDRIRPSGS